MKLLDNLIKSITSEDIKLTVLEVVKQLNSSSAAEARRRGLVPQSGDWKNPDRWVKPPENIDVNSGSGTGLSLLPKDEQSNKIKEVNIQDKKEEKYQPIHVTFNEIPSWVQQAWKKFNPNRRPNVTVKRGHTANIGPPYSDGTTRHIVAHNSSNKIKVESVPAYESLLGSPKRQQSLYMGGIVSLSPGNSIAVLDSTNNFAIIDLYVHPDDFEPSKTIEPSLTDRQRKILAGIRGFTSSYRKELFKKFKVTPLEIDELQQMGFIDKRGAITTMGKNISRTDKSFDPMNYQYPSHGTK